MTNQSAALHRIEHFRGMKTQRRHIPRLQYRFAVYLHAESMCRIINHFQTVFIRNLLNSSRITRFPVHVYRHDCRCLGSNSCLYLIYVDIASFRIDVHKHGLDTVPPQRMCRCNETVRRCNHFARDAQSLQSTHQRQSSICKQANVWHFQILAQSPLQFLMVMPVICNPFARPNIL